MDSFCWYRQLLLSISKVFIDIDSFCCLPPQFLLSISTKTFFPPSTLNMSTYCFLVTKVSDEKSGESPTGNPLYVTKHFFLVVCEILSLSLAVDSLIIIHVDVNFFEFILFGLC